jgi:hypothetical protein
MAGAGGGYFVHGARSCTCLIMTKKTLTALKGSIAHWERMRDDVAAPHESPGPDSCPLCHLYFGRSHCDIRCPIAAANHEHCVGTPYQYAEDLHDPNGVSAAFREAAQEEINFLKSLLPKQNGTKNTSRA